MWARAVTLVWQVEHTAVFGEVTTSSVKIVGSLALVVVPITWVASTG